MKMYRQMYNPRKQKLLGFFNNFLEWKGVVGPESLIIATLNSSRSKN